MTTLQKQIIKTLGVKPTINPEEEIRTRVDFLKAFTRNAGTKGFVLGISGGQDSALAGKLAQIAVEELREETGDNYTFTAVLLPYGVQKDGEEARIIAEDFIKADKVITVNIKDAVDALAATYNAIPGEAPLADYHKGNIKARVRMTAQYAIAGTENKLVIGTDHSSESVMGFFSKHGDGGADLLPLSGLNKRQGKALLKQLEAPEFVIIKAPTADLLDNTPAQADETELGLAYEIIDDYLEGKEISEVARQKIELRYAITEHKRQLPVELSDTWWK